MTSEPLPPHAAAAAPAPDRATGPGGLAVNAEEKLAALRAYLRQLGSALVCYSGGIDSALVLAVAHEQLQSRALAITAVSASLPAREREQARHVAEQLGARHELVESHEIERAGYVANGPDRCFHCKSELYDIARRELASHGLEHILNGTNRDDLGDYRPGLEAARQAGVKSPLAELGFGKQDVRAVAQLLGLSIWHKPAAACLASRIPYGTSVTRERLDQIERFEHDLQDLGFLQLRVRWHGKVARLELGTEELPRALEPKLRQAIIAAGKRHGFQYVTLDLEGYRTGSHNEVLPGFALKVV
jgi:pyridinium-3,5-biscarboxylic acid mononucleotide sulfurtransferase